MASWPLLKTSNISCKCCAMMVSFMRCMSCHCWDLRDLHFNCHHLWNGHIICYNKYILFLCVLLGITSLFGVVSLRRFTLKSWNVAEFYSLCPATILVSEKVVHPLFYFLFQVYVHISYHGYTLCFTLRVSKLLCVFNASLGLKRNFLIAE